MKCILSLSLATLISFQAWARTNATPPINRRDLVLAPTQISADFDVLSKGLPSGELQNSFCYAPNKVTDPDQLDIVGTNIDAPVRLASVSKIITSFWALSVLGPNFRYETQLSWNPKSKHLHIKGMQDPFMGQHSLMFLASALDELGIHDISLVSFDSNFFVYEFADTRSSYESSVGAQSNPPLQDSQIAVLKYFNTAQWPKNLVNLYKALRDKAGLLKIKMQVAPKIAVRNVILSDVDGVNDEPGTIHFSYLSSTLLQYLKHINTMSINYPPGMMFRSLGGSDALSKFLADRLRMRADDVSMYTGSGIEYYLDGEITKQRRVDNESSCKNILKIIMSLDLLLDKYTKNLQDIFLVAGVDQGTWNGSKEIAGAVTAKTGTLVQIPVSNLAGLASTMSGEYYFGIFFQLKDRNEIQKAHEAANTMVDDIVIKNGGKAKDPLATEAKSFVPFDSVVGHDAQLLMAHRLCFGKHCRNPLEK